MVLSGSWNLIIYFLSERVEGINSTNFILLYD
jgi:hypothetical protein